MKRQSLAYLQFHVTILEMLLLHSESQPQNCLLQSFTSRLQSFVLFDVFGAGVLTIDEPRQLHRWLRSARCAVNVDSIADLVSSTTACDSGIRFGQHWSVCEKMSETEREKNVRKFYYFSDRLPDLSVQLLLFCAERSEGEGVIATEKPKINRK